MPRLRPIPWSAWLALALVLVAGGALRAHQAAHPRPVLSQDATSYRNIAQSLARNGIYSGRGIPQPGSGPETRQARKSATTKALHWPPATPFLFAAAYRVAPGPHPASRKDTDVLHWTQFLVSTLTILAAFGLGWALAGPWAGVLGAAIVAVYPPLVWGPSTLLSEPLGALLVTSAFAALALAWRTGRRRWWAVAGAVFGGVLLARTDLLFVPALVALFGLVVLGNTVSWRRGLQSAALLVVLTGVVLAPWTVYATKTAGGLVPVTTGGGSALFVGTYLPGNGSTFDMKYAMRDEIVRLHPAFADRSYTKIPAKVVLDDVAARRPHLDRDAALSAAARQNLRTYALGQPVAFAQMMAFKVAKMWSRYARGGADHTQDRWLAVHLLIVAVSALGLLWGVVRRRDPAMVSVLLALGIATGVHTLAVAHGRYNLPLMPILIVAGAAGWTMALGEWRQRRRARARPVLEPDAASA